MRPKRYIKDGNRLRLAKGCRVPNTVSKLERAREHDRLTPEIEATIRAMREQAKTWCEIGEKLGWSHTTAWKWGRLLGLDTSEGARNVKRLVA